MITFGSDNLLKEREIPFILKIEDNIDNELKIIVALPISGTVSSNNHNVEAEGVVKLLKKAIPIYPDENNIYEITFDKYIMYQNKNESYCSWDDYEIRRGNFFIIFERSRLLDYLCHVTDCQQLSDGTWYPYKWVHYGIYTNNHILDVIAGSEPVIRKLSS